MNTNIFSLWFGPTGNRTRVYRFSSRHSIHSTTDRFLAMVRPIIWYACVFLAGGLNKKYLVRKLTAVQRLVYLMISSAFPGTLTGAPELLLNITPFKKFLLVEAVRRSYRIAVSGLLYVNPVRSFG